MLVITAQLSAQDDDQSYFINTAFYFLPFLDDRLNLVQPIIQ